MNFQNFLKTSGSPVNEAGAKFATKCYYKGSDGSEIVIDAIFKNKDGKRYAAKEHQIIRMPEVVRILTDMNGEFFIRLVHPHKEIKYKAANIL